MPGFVLPAFLGLLACPVFTRVVPLARTGARSFVARSVFVFGTVLALLTVLGRVGIETLAPDTETCGYLAPGVFGILFGGIGHFFDRINTLVDKGKRGKRPQDQGAGVTALDAEGGIPGATLALTRVRGAAAWLVVRSGAKPGTVAEIRGDKAIIGRSPDCAIRLDHPSVGSPHALIRVKQGKYTLSDVGSRTGTWVNGKLEAGVVLRDGSRISIGSTELFFSKPDGGGDKDKAKDGKQTVGGVLLVRSGPAMGQSYQFGRGDVVIGSEPGESGAQITDPTVSKRHALLRCMTRSCRLYDLGSTNGTKVDGVELQGVPLENGNIVKFGEIEAQFVHEEPA